MNYTIVQQPKIRVVGLYVRTSMETAGEDIKDLTGRFYSQNFKEQIVDRLSDDVYVVYTEYAGDYTQPYTCVIGCAVSYDTAVPGGMMAVDLLQGAYAEYKNEGAFPDSLIACWQGIWKSENDLDRVYHADYEVYPASFMDDEKKRYSIYVGIKQKKETK